MEAGKINKWQKHQWQHSGQQ